jgi:hypothetical protein
MYVNVWFDWNRDGDWDDTLQCPLVGPAPEWAVQNQPVSAAAPGTLTFTTPPFLPWHQAAGAASPQTWMRITLSEQPWQPLGAAGYAGSGPLGGYEFGETEDYYFTPVLCLRTVVARGVFYNNSGWDGNTVGFSTPAQENAAIPPDKAVLLPGQIAAANGANYTNFSRGTNGLYTDLMTGAGCSPLGSPTGTAMSTTDIAATFSLSQAAHTPTTDGSNIADYVALALPAATSVTLVSGGGAAGSDRVYIILPDATSANANWLRVVVKSAANGGKLDLSADDVFYFGWAKARAVVGYTGGVATVGLSDINQITLNPKPAGTALITDVNDNNRDKAVGLLDRNNAQLNPVPNATGLKQVTVP